MTVTMTEEKTFLLLQKNEAKTTMKSLMLYFSQMDTETDVKDCDILLMSTLTPLLFSSFNQTSEVFSFLRDHFCFKTCL